jgi:energy-coupling factor transporter ATP-binding protein EcfA2
MKFSFQDNIDAKTTIKFVNGTNRHIFLTGKAGSGKTTLLKNIIESTHKKVVVAAPTGVAAINAGGVTLHSLLHLPFGSFCPDQDLIFDENLNLNITTPKSIFKDFKMHKDKRKLLKEMDLLVIDEVSMLRADMLDAIDTILRHVRLNNQIPFGGVQILFIGDIFQLPPVVSNQEWSFLSRYYQDSFFFNSHILRMNQPIYIELKRIYRQQDKQFISVLNNLRINKVYQQDIDFLNTRYDPNFDLLKNKSYIFLSTHNRIADDINANALEKIENDLYEYEAKVEGDFKEKDYPLDSSIELKVGAQVMFIKNDPSGEAKYFNGKIGEVANLSNDSIMVDFRDGSPHVEVEKYCWENKRFKLNKETNEIEEEVLGTYTQYPLRLAWAITIHKSQGLTLDKAVIDVSKLFAPGQIYVALSRLTSMQGLVLKSKLNISIPKHSQNLIEFANSEKNHDDLNTEYENASIVYCADFILKTFSFMSIRNEFLNHLYSYNKDANKSKKQPHKPWFEKQNRELLKLHETGNKFCTQLHRLLYNKETTKVLERLNDSKKYFVPLLEKLIDEINLHRKEVKKLKGVKTYLNELTVLSGSLINHISSIHKSIKMIEIILENKEFTKEVFKDEYASKLIEESVAIDKKIPTKKISYNLYRAGKTVQEIAEERQLTIGTIYGHMKSYVEKGEVKAEEIIDEEKYKEIVKNLDKIEGQSTITPLVNYLGENYSYDEVRIVVAEFNRNKKSEA